MSLVLAGKIFSYLRSHCKGCAVWLSPALLLKNGKSGGIMMCCVGICVTGNAGVVNGYVVGSSYKELEVVGNGMDCVVLVLESDSL